MRTIGVCAVALYLGSVPKAPTKPNAQYFSLCLRSVPFGFSLAPSGVLSWHGYHANSPER
jgi:hypothetical protein